MNKIILKKPLKPEDSRRESFSLMFDYAKGFEGKKCDIVVFHNSWKEAVYNVILFVEEMFARGIKYSRKTDESCFEFSIFRSVCVKFMNSHYSFNLPKKTYFNMAIFDNFDEFMRTSSRTLMSGVKFENIILIVDDLKEGTDTVSLGDMEFDVHQY